MRYAFVDRQSGSYPVEMLCQAMQVSPSGYASWKRGERPRKRLTDDQLIVLIRAVHARTRGAYGSPRIYQEIKANGHAVSKTRVERLMREHGIRARHKRRYRATTNSRHSLPVAPNVLDRQFNQAMPNAAWATDITYIATAEGWLYLAVVLDLFSRKVVGWSFSRSRNSLLTQGALKMALSREQVQPGCLFHSDQGVEYAAHDFRNLVESAGMVRSMSRKGNPLDNATMESFFHSMKAELVHQQSFATDIEAVARLVEYMEFYNRERLHSGLGYQTPISYERLCA